MKQEILVRLNGAEHSTIGTLEVTDDQNLVVQAGDVTLEFQNVHFQPAYNMASGDARKRRVAAQQAEHQRILEQRNKRRPDNPFDNTRGQLDKQDSAEPKPTNGDE